MMQEKNRVPFTSSMSRWERAAALGYIPVHVYLLPKLLSVVFAGKELNALTANVICYAAATLILFFCLRRFFRREFDAMCDYGHGVLLEVAKSYGVLLLCNMAIGIILIIVGQNDNPNNAAVFSLAGEDLGKTTAVAVFMAPIAEEAMFRGGVFGLLRRYNRAAAYIGSMLLFSFYHIWSYAISDPAAWLYLLQYLPASFLLARIYEKTNTMWASIFLHMTVNGVSMMAISALGKLL